MAYAALISLENTIHRILNHDLFSISLKEKEQIISLLEHVSSFQGFLEEFPDKFNCLEWRMMDLTHETEDILEYLVLEKVCLTFDDKSTELQLETVKGEIDLIAREVDKIKGSERDAHSSARSSSSSASIPPIHKDVIVGFEDYVLHVKERLCADQPELQVVPICGMAGIGKTTLAKNVYDDPLITVNFDIRVWVTVSQDYTTNRIFSNLLEALKELDKGILEKTDKEKVHKILKARRYLVVMDDIWSIEAWDVVRNVFPDDCNGSRVLLTTRLSDVASYPYNSSKICEMHLMDANQSWMLFKKKVFIDEDCPPELENIGKEMVRSCKGLPLAIVVISGIVSTMGMNLASWKEIIENIKSTQLNHIEDILALSYFQLPQYLRPCFLYMGSFPEDYEINVTKLIRLWVAEGFLKSPVESHNFEKVAEECLEELVKRNLVLVRKRKFGGRIKSCVLHDLMRDFCIRKSHENMFFRNLMDRDIRKESFVESIKNQRCLNVDSSNVWHLRSSNNSIIHSIKCSGYLVPLYLGESVGLLRVLDAKLAVLEKSPSMQKLPELFHLRYLSVRYSPNLVAGLWNLQNLQTLIIHIKHKITSTGAKKLDDLRLPWCMPHLRHVYFHGTISFSDPKEATCSLGNLQTISYVSRGSCTEGILKKIPNLKKLKVDCSSARPNNGKAACLKDLVHLVGLQSLEVFAGLMVYFRPNHNNFILPKMLKKLILRYLVLPLKDFVVVGWLPNLQVLKLKGCTCLGESWETTEGEFPQLEFLQIERFNFKDWITESRHYPKLRRLSLISCRDLNEIPNDIGEIPTLELIEVKGDVKNSLMMSVEEIQKEQEYLGNDTLQVICVAKPIQSRKI